MLSDLLQNPEVQRLLLLTEDGLLFAIWETIYVTVLSTLTSLDFCASFRSRVLILPIIKVSTLVL